MLSLASAFSGIFVWTIGDNVSKTMRLRMQTHQCGQVEETKTLASAKIFCFVLVEKKTDTSVKTLKCVSTGLPIKKQI